MSKLKKLKEYFLEMYFEEYGVLPTSDQLDNFIDSWVKNEELHFNFDSIKMLRES